MHHQMITNYVTVFFSPIFVNPEYVRLSVSMTSFSSFILFIHRIFYNAYLSLTSPLVKSRVRIKCT